MSQEDQKKPTKNKNLALSAILLGAGMLLNSEASANHIELPESDRNYQVEHVSDFDSDGINGNGGGDNRTGMCAC